jgi:hypothetical protein
MYNPEKQKVANKKYLSSPKGQAWTKKYRKTEKFKEIQSKYQKSQKAIANRKAKPEIYNMSYKRKKELALLREIVRHDHNLKDDPEKLTTEYLCSLLQKQKEGLP